MGVLLPKPLPAHETAHPGARVPRSDPRPVIALGTLRPQQGPHPGCSSRPRASLDVSRDDGVDLLAPRSISIDGGMEYLTIVCVGVDQARLI